jgi:hypothetical protein
MKRMCMCVCAVCATVSFSLKKTKSLIYPLRCHQKCFEKVLETLRLLEHQFDRLFFLSFFHSFFSLSQYPTAGRDFLYIGI